MSTLGRCGSGDQELILTVSTLGRCGSLERTDFNSFYFGGCGSLEKLILTVSTLRRCGSLERTDFNSFYLWEGVVVLTELILTVSTFGKVWGS